MTLRLFVWCIALTLIALPAAAATSGKLVTAEGEVFVRAPGASETAARAGATLVAGSRIRTGIKGTAEVKFADGSLLKVRPGSSVMLSGNKRQKKKNSVLLFFGRVWSKVTRGATDRDKYEVSTANAVCGVRGTEFETAVADDGTVRVRVTEGTVGVGADGKEQGVGAGREVEGDDEGLGEAYTAEEKAKWAMWEKRKQERLNNDSRNIVDRVKARIMDRKAKIEALRARQQELESRRKSAEGRARSGDSSAVREIRKMNEELAIIADAIADLGDAAETQFGLVDHFADLAGDPRFSRIDRKHLESQAKSLRRVKATLDKLVSEGTDISIEAMDKMLDDMGDGKRNSLFDGKGSSADDLFGEDDF